MTVEELQVIVTARTRGLEQQMQALTSRLQGVQGQTNTMSTNMTRTFTNLKRTLLGLGIGKAIQSMFNLSRTYEASVQQVNRIFGLYSGALEKWIQKNAATFGLARADAMKYASVYGNLLSGFISDGAQLEQYTEQLLQSSSVIASSTGRTISDVMERIRSGLLGNTEAIEDLGVNVNVALLKTTDAFKTLANGKSWDQLSFQTQQQIRLMAILEQSSSKFGDNIQNNMNYKLMQLTANLKNVALNLGNAFMPIVNAVLPSLNAMALALANVTNKIASFMNALFGTNFNTGAGQVQQVATGASDAASGYEDMSNAADDAGESAKKAGQKAKNAIAGFDEINSLTQSTGSEDSSSGSGTSGSGVASDAGVATSTAMSEAAESFSTKMTDVIDRLKELFKEGFEIGLGDGWQAQVDDINKSIEGIKDSLKDIFTDSEVVSAAQRLAESIVLNLGKVTGSVASIGITIAQNLTGGIDKYLQQNSQFIKERIVGILNVVDEISTLSVDFAVAFADIFSVFGGENGQQITANFITMFSNAFLTVQELCLKFGADIIQLITQPIIDNKDAIKNALEGTLSVLSKLTGTVAQWVTDLCQTAIDVYEQYIGPAYDTVADALSSLFGTIVGAYNQYILPMLNNWADEFNKLYDDCIGPVMAKAIEVIGKFANMLSIFYANVLEPIISWLVTIAAPLIVGALNNLKSVFDVLIKFVMGALDGLLTALDGIITFLTGVFTGNWTQAWEGIKTLVTGAGQFIYNVTIKPLSDIGVFLAGAFKNSWNAALTAIKNLFSPLGSWFSSSVVTPIKNAFSTLWNGMKSGASSAFSAIGNSAKSGMNWVIGHINSMINKINSKLSFELPEFFGGGKVGFSIPNVPKLARGGIVDGATFMGSYIAGEAGKEMVVPLENTSFTDKIASAMGQAVMNAMSIMLNSGEMTGSNGQPIILQAEDGTIIARSMAPYMIKEFKRLGIDLD